MNSLALLILRLAFGLGMAYHGASSLFLSEDGLVRLTGVIEGKGWPAPEAMAYLAKITELAGGLFVAAGFLTRACSLALVATMGVAIWMAHADDPFSGGWELAAMYLAAFAALMLTGAGRFSVDGMRKDSKSFDSLSES